jgi:DNA-binding NtrC family response regulator
MAVHRTSVATASAVRAPARILVVDDDPASGLLLTAIGEREGYRIVSVDDGRKAYRMLRADADFAAAVFKMPLPHLNGVELISYMKSEKRLLHVPVVIVAEDHGLKLITDSFAAGALLFLPIPFTSEKLARTLRLAIGRGVLRTTQLLPR